MRRDRSETAKRRCEWNYRAREQIEPRGRFGGAGDSGHIGSPGGTQAPLHHVASFDDSAGRIFHGGLLSVQVVRERDDWEEENQNDNERKNAPTAILLAMPWQLLRPELPEEKGGSSHDQPDCVEQDFHVSYELLAYPVW